MQHISQEKPKQLLFSTIDSLFERKDEFLTNPQSDFTRTKKISFHQTILFPMLAGSDNAATELVNFFEEEKLPMPSAMVQRRSQVRSEAFKELFYSFSNAIPVPKKFQGYQIVACDGSRINLPYNPSDKDSFIKCIKGRKGINQVHLNALYDPLNDIFLDAELQSINQMNEKAAFTDFLDKYANDTAKRIFLADRGYVSYNIFAHAIHNKQMFLIRVPASFAEKICTDHKPWLADPFADETVTVHIGCSQKKEFSRLENYHPIHKSGRYDYCVSGKNDVDVLKFRVLKFPISDNSYEYIVTNLPLCSFKSEDIKSLYALRWGEETAFRHLKYAGNMVYIHSLKKDFLIQEIYGKLTLYNFSSYIAQAAIKPENKKNKHKYNLNHTQAQKCCTLFLLGKIKDVIKLISKYLVPIRPGRKFERILRRQSAHTLSYR